MDAVSYTHLDVYKRHELAGDFHSFYAACQVLPSEGRPVDPELSRARLAACHAVRVPDVYKRQVPKGQLSKLRRITGPECCKPTIPCIFKKQ